MRLRSASTIAGAYIAGGLIPLAPYMLMGDVVFGVDRVGRSDAGGSRDFRRDQGPLHRDAAVFERVSHVRDRRLGRRGRVRHRAAGVGQVATSGSSPSLRH